MQSNIVGMQSNIENFTKAIGSQKEELIAFISDVSGEDITRVEADLGEGFVRLNVAEAERRQAKHDIQSVEDAVIELARNARDAHARRIYFAISAEGGTRMLTIIDDGDGIPTHLHEQIFEARVTSKLESLSMDRWGVHGRGMALYSIKHHAKQARVVTSAPTKGTSIQVRFDMTSVKERADQSSLPYLERSEEDALEVKRGPHNIVRALVECMLERAGITIYLGSPSQIAATLLAHARIKHPSSTLLFTDDAAELIVTDRLAVAADASELSSIAQELGLMLSERTAQRIFCGEIKPLEDVLTQAKRASRIIKNEARSQEEATAAQTRAAQAAALKDLRGLRIAPEDRDELLRDMEQAFVQFAEKYYLSLMDCPRLRVQSDKITITFMIEK